MSLLEKAVHSLLLSILFSIVNWLVIKNLIIEVSFIKYFFMELIFVLSLKLYIFTKSKLDLN